MPLVKIYSTGKKKVSEMELDEQIFNTEIKDYLLHDVVRTQLANRRAGTASVKNRSMVRGGGRKPYRQKGTGRSRAGTIRSPLWRGGGVIFGPTPRDFGFEGWGGKTAGSQPIPVKGD
jgi:large subunit ribosomal protein L4